MSRLCTVLASIAACSVLMSHSGYAAQPMGSDSAQRATFDHDMMRPIEVVKISVDTVGLGLASKVSINVQCRPKRVKNVTARIVPDSGYEIVRQPQEMYSEPDTETVVFTAMIRATARGIWKVGMTTSGICCDTTKRTTFLSDFFIQISDTLCRAMTDAEYILLQSPFGKTERNPRPDRVINGRPGPMAQPAAPQPSESGYGGFRYIPKEPPATWEVSVLKTPQKIGDELQVQISLKFDEMPDCGVWDSVWQATILITRPDNSPRKYSSELTPIVVGKTEVFSIGEDATFEGTYQIAAEIVACTPKSDWDPSTDRGNTFAFMSKIVQNSVRIPITSQPDTGWHQLKNSTVMIKKLDGLGPPPEMQTKKMKLEVSKETPPETSTSGKEYSGTGSSGFIRNIVPIAGQLTLGALPKRVGDLLTVTVAFRFLEIPTCSLDSLWKASVIVTRPDGSRQIYKSDLQPIVLGKNENFTITEAISVEGRFDIAAGIGAFTVRLGEPGDSIRGDYFEYYKPIGKQSFTLGLPRRVEPKWTKIGKDSILVVPVDGSPPLPRGKAVEVVEAAPTKEIAPDRKRERPDTIRFSFPPDWGTTDTITVGDLETESRQEVVIRIERAARLDSVVLVNSKVGTASILDDSTIALRPTSERVSGELLIYSGDHIFRIRLNRPKVGFWVTGLYAYEDEQGHLQPAGRMYAATYTEVGGEWLVCDNGWTDTTGYVSLLCDQSPFLIYVYAMTTNATVYWVSDHHFDPGDDLYYHAHGLQITNPSLQDMVIDTAWTNVRWTGLTGAFNIARALKYGELQLIHTVNPFPLPDPLPVLWDNACSQFAGSFYGGFYVNGHEVIFISGENSLYDNRDQWDYPVILHEYSHLLMNEYASIDDNAARRHGYYSPAVPDTLWISKIVAYSEGWATFFQGVLRSSPTYLDRDNNNYTLLHINLEQPNPDVPYFKGYNQNGPSNPVPFFDGADVEGAVTEALWDVFDGTDDDNYYISGQLRGHNNDHNTSDSWSGIDAIWDVFWDYDPWPDSAGQQYCNSINQFIVGWGSKGYPVGGHFRDIFLAHAIDICTCGDANGSGIVNIADAVFLIAYIFAGGTPPGDCLYSMGLGDANGTGTVNISDAVYLIAYIFAGGTTPHCQ